MKKKQRESKSKTAYGDFLLEQRTRRNVDRAVLGEGIYSDSMIGKLERGECYPEKLTRDCLLARLGECGYDYECFLEPREYAVWELRRNILDSLDDLELDKAENLISEYEKKVSLKEKVPRQFVLAMRVQWMQLSGICAEKWGRLLEEAIELTVPAVDEKPLAERVLSVQELNLLLEYWTYKYPEQLKEKCLQLLSYLENHSYDKESEAMLKAKTALCYCADFSLAEEKDIGQIELNRLLQTIEVCTKGIEALRNHQKIYFVWELLQKKKKYIEELFNYKIYFSEIQIRELEKELEQVKEFYRVIDTLYEKHQISKETNGFTCFYREHEIYCINDVIRARRRMLGISSRELEENRICSKKTIERIEARIEKLQLETSKSIFSYLKLSAEPYRAQIITESKEAIWVEKEYRRAYNLRDFKKAEELLQQLKSMISLEENINWQYVLFEDTHLAYYAEKISREEYIQSAKEALEVTIPMEIAMANIKEIRHRNGRLWPGEKYLTNMEITILYNIACECTPDDQYVYWEVLKEYFAWLEEKCTLAPILGMYGFVMTTVASKIGNKGQYEESNAINRKILRELLRTRSVSHAHGNMYGLLWNERMQQGLPMTSKDPGWKQGLLDCLAIDVYCKNTWLERKVRERLEK